MALPGIDLHEKPRDRSPAKTQEMVGQGWGVTRGSRGLRSLGLAAGLAGPFPRRQARDHQRSVPRGATGRQ